MQPLPLNRNLINLQLNERRRRQRALRPTSNERADGTQYADGFSYSKGKLEEAWKEIAEKVPAKPHKDPAVAALKKEDIDLVVRKTSLRVFRTVTTILSSNAPVDV